MLRLGFLECRIRPILDLEMRVHSEKRDWLGASTGAIYPDYLTEDALDQLAGLGFGSLELMLQSAGEYTAEFASTLSRKREQLGVRVRSVHLNTSLHPVIDPYSRRREEAVALFRRGVEVARDLNAEVLVWHGVTQREARSRRVWQEFRGVVEVLAGTAEKAGMTLTLENVSWCLVRDPASVETVRRWGLPVGFTFDPFQAMEAGVEPQSVLHAMGDQLRNVHLSDYRVGAQRHLMPGEGDFEWPALLKALQSTGYPAPLIIEGNCGNDIDRLRRRRAYLATLHSQLFNAASEQAADRCP